MSINHTIGTIRRGQQVGKQPYVKYIVAVCPDCGELRWVQLRHYNKKPYRQCNNCAMYTKLQKSIAVRRRKAGYLTPKQKQVLIMLSQGLATKQIAIKLGISFYSAAHIQDNIYKKLDVNNRVSAVMKLVHGEVK